MTLSTETDLDVRLDDAYVRADGLDKEGLVGMVDSKEFVDELPATTGSVSGIKHLEIISHPFKLVSRFEIISMLIL